MNSNIVMAEKTVHQGRNLKRIREILGVKQEALAYDLGDDWNQQKVSYLEQKEEIDPTLLADIARILKVTPEAIKNFSEETPINFISNTFTDNQFAGYTVNNNPTFNPLDKLLEMVEENKKLYEALLKEKDEKIALLERLAAGDKKMK